MMVQLEFGLAGGHRVLLWMLKLHSIVSDGLTGAVYLFWQAHAYLRMRFISHPASCVWSRIGAPLGSRISAPRLPLR
jgi:hypothetical protein